MSIISAHTHFVTSFIKSPHISGNMTIFHSVLLKRQDGYTPYSPEFFASPLNMHPRTSNLQCLSKQIKPSHASLFYLLPTHILTDIEIWVYGLEHCDKFKHVVLCFKTMCNLIIFTIPHNL